MAAETPRIGNPGKRPADEPVAPETSRSAGHPVIGPDQEHKVIRSFGVFRLAFKPSQQEGGSGEDDVFTFHYIGWSPYEGLLSFRHLICMGVRRYGSTVLQPRLEATVLCSNDVPFTFDAAAEIVRRYMLKAPLDDPPDNWEIAAVALFAVENDAVKRKPLKVILMPHTAHQPARCFAAPITESLSSVWPAPMHASGYLTRDMDRFWIYPDGYPKAWRPALRFGLEPKSVAHLQHDLPSAQRLSSESAIHVTFTCYPDFALLYNFCIVENPANHAREPVTLHADGQHTGDLAYRYTCRTALMLRVGHGVLIFGVDQSFRGPTTLCFASPTEHIPLHLSTRQGQHQVLHHPMDPRTRLWLVQLNFIGGILSVIMPVEQLGRELQSHVQWSDLHRYAEPVPGHSRRHGLRVAVMVDGDYLVLYHSVGIPIQPVQPALSLQDALQRAPHQTVQEHTAGQVLAHPILPPTYEPIVTQNVIERTSEHVSEVLRAACAGKSGTWSTMANICWNQPLSMAKPPTSSPKRAVAVPQPVQINFCIYAANEDPPNPSSILSPTRLRHVSLRDPTPPAA